MSQILDDRQAPEVRRGALLLRVTLWITLFDLVAFGGAIFLTPSFVVEVLGDSPAFAYFSLRWSGGILLGMGLAVWHLLRKPTGQLPVFTAIATATTLAGIGKAWSVFGGEYEGPARWAVMVLLGTLGVGILQWFARSRSRHLLE
jgi:hypothetical protein